MILKPEDWSLGYSQVLMDCRPSDEGSSGSALILCNADVDAMAAARILSYMLRNDGIPYQLLPCMSYSSMKKILSRNMADGTDVRAVFALNLGASRNLTRLFDDENLLNTNVKVYVLDCRRPVHLANVHAGNNVVVFWDPVQDDDEIPSDGDNLSGNESSTSEEESSEDEDDDESSSEGEQEFEDDDGEHEFGDDDDMGIHESSSDIDVADPVNDADDYDAEDEQENDENEDDNKSHGTSSKSKRRKTKKVDDNSDLDKDMEDESQSMTEKSSEALTSATATTTTQSTTLPALTPRERHQDRRNRLRTYYTSGSFYGSPAAFVAYRISSQLRFEKVGDLLWLACVGVTDAYLHARLDVAGYTAFAIDLRNYCNKLFPNDMYRRVENAVYAEHLERGGNRSENTASQNLTKIGYSENGRVLSENDFRFFLLRHASLFDAMVYSDFISTRFQLLTSQGMHKLQEMLAKMGYPLEECHQPFAFMKPALRRRLQGQIRLHAEEYGLENFEFTSFFRVTGYQSLLSACDTSYAVTALLECDMGSSPTTAASTQVGDAEQQEDDELMQAFNVAYDALNSNATPTVSLNGLSGEGNNLTSLVNGGNLSGNTGLGAGIRQAMSLQKNIMTTAASLIDRSAITRLSHFRYAYITVTSQAENRTSNEGLIPAGQRASEEVKHHIFAKPLALSRLAHYLMDLHRENGKWTGTKARPLILMAEKPRTKTYVVVGYEYPENAGNFVKNRFGTSFELAAQSMKGNFKFDSFDTNVVEVGRSDVQRFIEQLHYLMDSI